ncbi:MAG: TerB family tellurite resistance protein [Gammaproteobacteria bacterium]
MSVDKFLNISKIFGGKSISEDEENDLYKETLIMALCRMTRADLTIEAAEVNAVIAYVEKATGSKISDATVRSAASSELFETMPLEKQLKKVSKHLSVEHRVSITKGLAEVIGSDGQISANETDFFNTLVSALGVTPAELVFG